MLVYFVRHGQTDDNVFGLSAKFAGDAPLNDTGRQQAIKAGLVLSQISPNWQAIYSSSYKRAIQTAEIIAKQLKSSNLVVSGLGEAKFGQIDGKTIQQSKEAWLNSMRLGDIHIKPAGGGETMNEIADRMIRVVGSFHPDHQQSIVIVSHAAPIRFALAKLLSSKSDNWQDTLPNYDNGSISALEYQNGSWKALFLNKR